MSPSMFEIAIFLLVVSVGLAVWFEKYRTAASTSRRMAMMRRLALDPEIGSRDDPNSEAILRDVRRRCRRCEAEDLCERWLAGEVRGRNSFCPNWRVFRRLKRTAGGAR